MLLIFVLSPLWIEASYSQSLNKTHQFPVFICHKAPTFPYLNFSSTFIEISLIPLKDKNLLILNSTFTRFIAKVKLKKSQQDVTWPFASGWTLLVGSDGKWSLQLILYLALLVLTSNSNHYSRRSNSGGKMIYKTKNPIYSRDCFWL